MIEMARIPGRAIRTEQIEALIRRAFPDAKVYWRPADAVNSEEYKVEVGNARALFRVPMGFFSGREDEAVREISERLALLILHELMKTQGEKP